MLKKRLLYIDDNFIDHSILKIMQDKYQTFKTISHRMDGIHVIRDLMENKTNQCMLPDVIFIDLYMSNYSGWDFLEDLKDLYACLIKPVRVYIVSSSILPSDIRRSGQYPFVLDYLIKPLTKEMLMRIG